MNRTQRPVQQVFTCRPGRSQSPSSPYATRSKARPSLGLINPAMSKLGNVQDGGAEGLITDVLPRFSPFQNASQYKEL